MVCGFQVPHSSELSRRDFYQEFLNLIKYYGIGTEKFAFVERQRLNFKSKAPQKWLKQRWDSYYALMYDWDVEKILKHPRETLQWSQVKGICAFYFDLDIRFNLNRKIASSKNDSFKRKRARAFQFVLRKFSEALLKQKLHKKLAIREVNYNISPEKINRFILMYARDYIINLASLTISRSMRLAAYTYRQNFALRVPTFKQYRRVYNREVFTRLWPFDLKGQLERQLSASKITGSTFVLFEGKKIRSQDTIFITPDLRFKVLDILLPTGTARTSAELISNLEKMSVPYKALLQHRSELSKQWNKSYDLVESKRTEERLIELLTRPEEEE